MTGDGKSSPPSGFSQTVHQYLNQFIGYADAKLGAVIAGNILIAATILQAHAASRGLSFYLGWVAVGVFSLSSIIGSAGFFPHIDIKAVSNHRSKRVSRYLLFPSLLFGSRDKDTSVIFWEGILSHCTPERYGEAVGALTPNDIEQQFAFENFQISRVLHKKYAALQLAVNLFACGLILTVISLFVSI